MSPFGVDFFEGKDDIELSKSGGSCERHFTPKTDSTNKTARVEYRELEHQPHSSLILLPIDLGMTMYSALILGH